MPKGECRLDVFNSDRDGGAAHRQFENPVVVLVGDENIARRVPRREFQAAADQGALRTRQHQFSHSSPVVSYLKTGVGNEQIARAIHRKALRIIQSGQIKCRRCGGSISQFENPVVSGIGNVKIIRRVQREAVRRIQSRPERNHRYRSSRRDLDHLIRLDINQKCVSRAIHRDAEWISSL